MIVDLFEVDKTIDLKKRIEKLRSYFEERVQGIKEVKPNIQRDYNEISSLRKYQNTKSENAQLQLKEKINELYHEYKGYLPPNEIEKFITDFPLQFWHNTFPLIMMQWISKHLKLNEQVEDPKGAPDLMFSEGFMECTTIATSLLDIFDKLLPSFNSYSEVMIFLHEKFGAEEYWFWSANLKQKIYLLSSAEKQWFLDKIYNEHKCASIDQALREAFHRFSKWIYINAYAVNHFYEVIPTVILDRFELIGFNFDYSMLGMHIAAENISSNADEYNDKRLKDWRCRYSFKIAKSLLDKIEKGYFSEDKLGILSVSLAMYHPGFFPLNVENLMNYLIENLFLSLNTILDEYEKDRSDKIRDRLRNLYAVLIDPSANNWFPDILGSKMPEGYDNAYAIICNRDIDDKETKKILDDKIKRKVPFETTISFQKNNNQDVKNVVLEFLEFDWAEDF